MLKALVNRRCLLCRCPVEQGLSLCLDCLTALPVIQQKQVCHRCANTCSDERSDICGQCLKMPPAFDTTLAWLEYSAYLPNLIHQIKFRQQATTGLILAKAMGEYFFQMQDMLWPELLVPVPLHHWRFRRRGFNQSQIIAKALGKKLKIPIDLTSCTRTRSTPQQSQLNKGSRQRNLQDAFQCEFPRPYQHIALIDDVMTTGSTVQALAKACKAAGASRVDVWVMCRA